MGEKYKDALFVLSVTCFFGILMMAILDFFWFNHILFFSGLFELLSPHTITTYNLVMFIKNDLLHTTLLLGSILGLNAASA